MNKCIVCKMLLKTNICHEKTKVRDKNFLTFITKKKVYKFIVDPIITKLC